MKNLQVTARMATAIAVSDNWSPMLDGLLQWLWLDERGLATSNPQSNQIIEAPIPLRKDCIKEVEFWACSAPFYQQQIEEKTRYRKRWDYQDKHCNWGKKKAKVNSSEGHTKSYDLPLRIVETPRIDWFCVGNPDEILSLLARCQNLGKKRSQGKGQVYKWEINEIDEDWSLYRNGKLTRPFPLELVDDPMGYDFMRWGWNPPVWLLSNQVTCLMPNNIYA